MEPWMHIAALGVSIVLAVGIAGRMVINAAASNMLKLKAAARAPMEGEQAQRIAQLEAEVSSLREEMGRLGSVEQFYARLQAPAAPRPPASPPGA